MHYYQFNIGDYSSHTSRLSVHEDLVYRRLLDLYYLNERPLNGCITDVARDIGMTEYVDDITYILAKFFTETDTGWCNKRCDSEIKAYQNKRESASKAGKASAEARRSKASEQTFNDRSTDVQPNIKQEPLNTKQEPTKKKGRFTPPSVSELQIYISEKTLNVDPDQFIDFYESKGWMVGKNKMKSWKASARTWSKRQNQRGNTNGQTIGSHKPTLIERVEAAGRRQLEQEQRESSIIDITAHAYALGKDD